MHTCRDCNRTFPSELALELHRDECTEGDLFCQECGERFSEQAATRDGWHYRCVNADCDGQGMGDDLLRVDDIRAATQ
ncbi:transcriptional regulator [Halobacteriales archaeon SW_7_68_16]|nr:MAG: transcriptional regulator [Halobacteriales archaeon SW_7_68_16]